MPKFERQIYDIQEKDISLVETALGLFALNALSYRLDLTVECSTSKWLLKSFNGGMSASIFTLDFEGTRDQITDCSLLRLRRERMNAVRSVAWRKVHKTVTGDDGDYSVLLEEHLAKRGCTSETDWIIHCVSSRSVHQALETINAAGDINDDRFLQTLCQIRSCKDAELPGQDRPPGFATLIENNR